MDIFKPITQNIGFANTRHKFYTTAEGGYRLAETCVFSERIFNPDKLERANERTSGRRKTPSADETADEAAVSAANKCSSDYATRRARRRLFDLVSCNADCNMMVTLTLNGEDFPRDEWGAIIPKLSTWLDNMTRRRGMKYILVPEFHKDGKSIHFHGFVNENSLSLSRAINPHNGKPIMQKGRAVYNIDNWKYGYTTAVRVGKSAVDQSSSAKYVLKYITKADEKIGGRYYLHGGDLAEPLLRYENRDYSSLTEEDGWQEFVITENLKCKIKKTEVS